MTYGSVLYAQILQTFKWMPMRFFLNLFFSYSENYYGWNFPWSKALIMQAALIPYYPMGSMYVVHEEKKKYLLNRNQISVLQ